MTSSIHIRAATENDAAALSSIYRPIVEHTAISFEETAPSIAEFARRISTALGRWQWLVAEKDGECLGYAYGRTHRERAAYRWSAEVSAYVHPAYQRRGIGRALYGQLFEDLKLKGICNVYAGVTLPNDASVGLHISVGFQPIGTFKSVGRKFRRWHDVAWFQRALCDVPPFEWP